jgi:hypothetical protein
MAKWTMEVKLAEISTGSLRAPLTVLAGHWLLTPLANDINNDCRYLTFICIHKYCYLETLLLQRNSYFIISEELVISS